MRIELPIREGRLIRRYKRFLADIELPDGEVIIAHCPNTGAMRGCTPAGARTILRDSQNPKRKLRYTFQTIEVDGTWVNVDTGLPNHLVAEAVNEGRIAELTGYATLRREVAYGENSRIDLLLEDETKGLCYVEVKSTTLVRGEQALFPDAVTLRGRKHLEELARMVQAGHRAVIFFLVSRDDVRTFAPADDVDPEYGSTLRRVVAEGVEALAYTAHVEPESMELGLRLPIEL